MVAENFNVQEIMGGCLAFDRYANSKTNMLIEIRKCFELYARKKYIDKEAQLRFIMRTLGHVVTPVEVKDYMREFGPQIRLPQFLELLWRDRQKPEDPVWEVAKAFRNLDENQTGYINRTKLFTLLSGFGEKMEPVEIQIALERMRLSAYGLRIPITSLIDHISG
ncbi:hypothetical protein M3Y97_00449600 [Aphelenchoides bicaudatus]|nr:hypothetical protein M3Y97_00449600 [Aphelenchoides bicaudatus]